MAGIGNIYADESLYSAGISPFRAAQTIKKNELIKLKKSIITVLKKSIGSGGRHLVTLETWRERVEILVYRLMFIGELVKNVINVET